MCATRGFPGQEAAQGPAAGLPRRCRECGRLRLAEAEAAARHDYSEATDCRVLLRRHRLTADCPERGEGMTKLDPPPLLEFDPLRFPPCVCPRCRAPEGGSEGQDSPAIRELRARVAEENGLRSSIRRTT
ncbi:hypothetical protein [Streptomyces atroolivaceus]|uniref:hypothetical protein n=1 Tax=Streptomyces atroolivaceus TaxID=66869 RepID=UPI00344703CB